jgi:hypothetical protein
MAPIKFNACHNACDVANKVEITVPREIAVLGFCADVNKPALTSTKLYQYLRAVQVQIYRLGKMRFENVQLLLKS